MKRATPSPSVGSPATRVALRLLPLAALIVQIQPASAAGWRIEPSVSLSETLTDNANLSSDKRADALSQATAAVRLSNAAGRVKGFVDYSLTGSLSTRSSDLNQLQNTLSALVNAELLENRAFVDIQGSISQQAISAFGAQSSDRSVAQNNRTEVSTFSLSPYVRGRLGGFADYEARLSHEISKSGTSSASDTSNSSASTRLNGGAPGAAFGWSADLSRNVADFSEGQRSEDDRAQATLRYVVDSDLQLGINAGRESNNYISVDKRSYSTWGAQLNWSPSPRTTLAASVTHRFFGNGYNVSFVHRSARTVWTFTDTRDVSTSNTQGKALVGSTYDLFFRQFASVEPDPVRRDVLVRNFLQSNGIDNTAQVVAGFLASAATLQRQQSLSFALLGVRTTLTLRATRSESRRLSNFVTAFDDFSRTNQIRQRGLVVDIAHRLTPQSSVNLSGSVQKTSGQFSDQGGSLKSISAAWSGKSGPRSSVSAGVRHVRYDSLTQPYDENAVFGSFRLQF